MKKLVVLVLVVAAGVVAFVVHAQSADPVRAACRHSAELCAGHADDRDVDQCVEQMNEVRRVAGPEGVDHAVRCVNEVNTCGGAMGCMAGGAVRSVGSFMRDFGGGLAR